MIWVIKVWLHVDRLTDRWTKGCKTKWSLSTTVTRIYRQRRRNTEMSKSVRHASKTDKICSCLTKITQILVRMSDGEVWGTQQSLTMKCPLVTWRQQKYFFFFFLYCAWLQSESLAHIFKAKELKSKPETKSEADKALILQIKSVQKDIETTCCN